VSTSEGIVQVAPDSTGKKIRNRTHAIPQGVDTSGNAVADVTAYGQVIHLANESGALISDPSELLGDILAAQERTNELLELVLEALS